MTMRWSFLFLGKGGSIEVDEEEQQMQNKIWSYSREVGHELPMMDIKLPTGGVLTTTSAATAVTHDLGYE